MREVLERTLRPLMEVKARPIRANTPFAAAGEPASPGERLFCRVEPADCGMARRSSAFCARGLPDASLASIVTSAGLVPVPPITSAF